MDVDLIARRLRPRLPLYRQNSDLYPLFAFRRELRNRGVVIRVHTWAQARSRIRKPSHVLCVDSRALSYDDGKVTDADLETLASFRSAYERIVWLDNRDSAGTTQFEVLPLVDVYCKKQYLRDRSLYRRSFYSDRLFADYYHREHGVVDDQPEPVGEPLAAEYEDKLAIHWNLAYRPFGQRSRLELYAHLFLPTRPPRFVPWRATQRDIDLHARFGTRYGSQSVAFQRRALLERVRQYRDLQVRTGRTSPRQYLEELARTAAVLSPFGWGEVCIRDFEAFVFGAALIKPDVSHLETWPDLFEEDVTYLSVPWDPDAAARRIEELVSCRDRLEEVAHHGQSKFRKAWDPDGIAAFCDRFAGLLSDRPEP